ncbi:MAG: hypothetical protein ACEPOV_04995 [Hyphomicrobiales bacterium]
MKTKQINYSRRKSHFTKNDGTNVYFPKIHYSKTVKDAEFVELATKENGIRPEIFKACMDSFITTLGDVISNGNILSTSWINGVSIMKGTSPDKEAVFDLSDKENNSIHESISLPIGVRQNIYGKQNILFVKEKYYTKVPAIYSVFQIFPYQENIVERGNIGKISGKNLFCEDDNKNTGVFIKDAEGNKIMLPTSQNRAGSYVKFKVPIDAELGEHTLNFAYMHNNEIRDYESIKRITIV